MSDWHIYAQVVVRILEELAHAYGSEKAEDTPDDLEYVSKKILKSVLVSRW